MSIDTASFLSPYPWEGDQSDRRKIREAQEHHRTGDAKKHTTFAMGTLTVLYRSSMLTNDQKVQTDRAIFPAPRSSSLASNLLIQDFG
jgi:hypothetical protein